MLQRLGLASYLADNYGTCRLGEKCACLRAAYEWNGQGCQNREPASATTWDELMQWQEKTQ